VGAKAGDLARKHGIPRRRCWKAKYGGMDVSDAKHYGRREQKAEEVAG
jgi:hypothetical protein